MIPYAQNELYKSKLDEISCIIKKAYVKHWALIDLKNEFIISNKNTWDPHPINIVRSSVLSRNYTTLAESERGAQIAVHQNSFVLQFHVETKYPSSVIILRNFINHHLLLIQNSKMSRIAMTIDEADAYERTVYFEVKTETLKLAAHAAKMKGMEKMRRALLEKQQNLQYSSGFTHSGIICTIYI